MSLKRSRSRKVELSKLCGQPGEDDGVDPRLAVHSHSRARNAIDRKTLQMCSQVAHVVAAVLSGETSDDDLSGLHVVSVTPASQRGKLLISLTPGEAATQVSPDVVLAKLKQHAGRIRAEVAASISRRKAPELAFAFVPRLEMEVRDAQSR